MPHTFPTTRPRALDLASTPLSRAVNPRLAAEVNPDLCVGANGDSDFSEPTGNPSYPPM